MIEAISPQYPIPIPQSCKSWHFFQKNLGKIRTIASKLVGRGWVSTFAVDAQLADK
ncbi:MAG: hypothetical protein KME59_21005 [Trichormus sp. ATA11-4-KO1]|jgi:hypothetical protein|nr:hypothetical protein [Trichormus sp. ATA11-4-KO1]